MPLVPRSPGWGAFPTEDAELTTQGRRVASLAAFSGPSLRGCPVGLVAIVSLVSLALPRPQWLLRPRPRAARVPPTLCLPRKFWGKWPCSRAAPAAERTGRDCVLRGQAPACGWDSLGGRSGRPTRGFAGHRGERVWGGVPTLPSAFVIVPAHRRRQPPRGAVTTRPARGSGRDGLGRAESRSD